MNQFPNYEGYESSFPTKEALLQYRAQLLDKTRPQTDFILELARKWSIKTISELACGNGRLLIDLASRSNFERLEGIDRSESRIKFGNDWIDSLKYMPGIDKVSLVVDTIPFPSTFISADLTVMLTGAFQYFEPAGELDNLMTLLADSSIHNGMVLIELYGMSRDRYSILKENNWYLIGEETLVDDPVWHTFKHEYEFKPAARIMKHTKSFYGRDGEVDLGRSEYLKEYYPEEIYGMFKDYGFTDIEEHDVVGWNEESIVITARGPNARI